jgi:hypothetical protein
MSIGFYIAFVWFLLVGVSGCTTFYQNSGSVNRACKSGVHSYDDGSTQFICNDPQNINLPKNVGKDHTGD